MCGLTKLFKYQSHSKPTSFTSQRNVNQTTLVMYQQVIISILWLRLTLSTSNFLDIENNHLQSKLERNSVLNKGVWVKNLRENEKSTANFLFRGSPVDVDNQLQGDFNPFEDGNGPSSAFISSYVERAKRSLERKYQNTI